MHTAPLLLLFIASCLLGNVSAKGTSAAPGTTSKGGIFKFFHRSSTPVAKPSADTTSQAGTTPPTRTRSKPAARGPSSTKRARGNPSKSSTRESGTQSTIKGSSNSAASDTLSIGTSSVSASLAPASHAGGGPSNPDSLLDGPLQSPKPSKSHSSSNPSTSSSLSISTSINSQDPLLPGSSHGSDVSASRISSTSGSHLQQPTESARPGSGKRPKKFWRFGPGALKWPSFQLASQGFKHAAMAQGFFIMALSTIGRPHYSAFRSFRRHYELTNHFYKQAKTMYNMDPDPIRKGLVFLLLKTLQGELALMAFESAHLPPESHVVRGVIKGGKLAKDAIAYVGMGIVGGIYFFVFEPSKAIFRAAKYTYTNWFPLHRYEKGQSPHEKYEKLLELVTDEYGGDWQLMVTTETASFSKSQSERLSSSSAHSAFAEEYERRARKNPNVRPVSPRQQQEWDDETARISNSIESKSRRRRRPAHT